MSSLGEALAPLLLSPDDVADMDVHGRIDAAVLVSLFERDGEIHAVFTKRRADLRRHAGEISFPGGRQDIGEEDLRETALREAEEEIGLPREEAQIIGALAPTATFVTNYAVYPFVAVIDPGHVWRPSEMEVDVVLELPLLALRDSHEMRRLVRRGVPFRTHVYELDGNFIWGATARMVCDLFERIGPLLDEAPRSA